MTTGLVNIKSHVELQDSSGETLQRRPLRKHKQAITSLSSLQAQLLDVHRPEIQDLHDTGLPDCSQEFLHRDSDGDWVILEWDDITHPHANFVQIKILLRQRLSFQHPPPRDKPASKPTTLPPMRADLVKCGPTTTTSVSHSSASLLEDSAPTIPTHDFDTFGFGSFKDSELTASPTEGARPPSTLSQCFFDKDASIEAGPSGPAQNDPKALDEIASRCRSFTHCDVDASDANVRLYWVDEFQGDLGFIDLKSNECCVLVERLQRPAHIKLMGTLALFVEVGGADSTDGGSISCIDLITKQISVVLARVFHPIGICTISQASLAFGQCVKSNSDHILTISTICDVSLAMKCAQDNSPPNVQVLVTKTLSSDNLQPTAISVSTSGVLCVGFAAAPPYLSTMGLVSLWIPTSKCMTADLFEYTNASSIDLETPNSVRNVVCDRSWPFFYFCMADEGKMAHSSALGRVEFSSPPQLALDAERFIPSTCMAGSTDRVFYCAHVSSSETLVYTFNISSQSRRETATDLVPDCGKLAFQVPDPTTLPSESNDGLQDHQRLDGPVNIQVILRSRPLLPHELDRGVRSVVSCNGCNVHVAPTRSYQEPKHFKFDKVYGPTATQHEVYQTSILPLIHRVLQGYKCTVFAYGQTGSGKTHSMEGSKDDPGMIFQSIATIFDELRHKLDFRVRMSHVEIYNEELTDLLSTSQSTGRLPPPMRRKSFKDMGGGVKKAHPGLRGLSKTKSFVQSEGLDEADDDLDMAKLSIVRHPSHGLIVQGLEEFSIQSPADAQSLLERSFNCRQKAATLCNKMSSRSHSILTVHTEVTELESGEPCTSYGQLRLVDLSGSENYERAGALKERQLEAANIGQGLLALGRVIRALVEKWPHVPYRESKLTRFLEDSLGGASMTTLLLAVSPGDEAHEETLNTLNYATMAKRVTTRPKKSCTSKNPKKAALLPLSTSHPTLREPTVVSPWQGHVPIRASKTDLKRLVRATDRAIHLTTSEWSDNIVSIHDNEKRLSKKATRVLRAIFNKFDSKKCGVLCKHDARKVYHELFQLQKSTAPHQLPLDEFLAKFEQFLTTNPIVARHVFTSQGYTLNMEKATPQTAKDASDPQIDIDIVTSVTSEPNVHIQDIGVAVGNFRGLRDMRKKKMSTRPSSAPLRREVPHTQTYLQFTERIITR